MKPSTCQVCDAEADLRLDDHHDWICEECDVDLNHEGPQPDPQRVHAATMFRWLYLACQNGAPRAEIMERLAAVRAANEAIDDPSVRGPARLAVDAFCREVGIE